MSHQIDLPEDVARRVAMLVDDPAAQRALDTHLDALCKDMDDGKGIETTPAELLARVRVRLGVPPA